MSTVTTLVPAPDLAAMQRVLGEAKELTQPLIGVESRTRERFIGEMREHEAALEDLEDKRELFVRETNAVLAGLDAQIADRRGAISLYRGGLAPEIDQRLDDRAPSRRPIGQSSEEDQRLGEGQGGGGRQ